MFGYDLGIDLGSSSIIITVPGKGVVVNEPNPMLLLMIPKLKKYCMPEGVLIILRAESRMGVTVIQPIV